MTPATACRRLFALAVVVLAAALAAPAEARDCEIWKNGFELRCLSQGDAARSGEPVRIFNAGPDVETFSLQQWYSVCGRASGHPPSELTRAALKPGEAMTVQLPAHPDAAAAGTEALCTELFIFDCNEGRKVCPTDLLVEISAPVTPQPRACEAFDDSFGGSGDANSLRCFSQGSAARKSGTVLLTNLANERVRLELRIWLSACGWDGLARDGKQDFHLDAGQTRSIAVDANGHIDGRAQEPSYRCTEVILSHCQTSGGGPLSCAAILHATVVP